MHLQISNLYTTWILTHFLSQLVVAFPAYPWPLSKHILMEPALKTKSR